MATHPEAGRAALVILTSNRGLCGGYNANVLREGRAFLDERETQGLAVDTTMVGKKGVGFFRFLKRPVAEAMTELGDIPSFDQVEPLAQRLMDRFTAGEIESLHVAYTRFVSTARQIPVVEQLLPLAQETSDEEAADLGRVDYEYSPTPKELLEELLPATVRVRFYQCFTEAVVSEQIARMVAMKGATDAAGDMIKRLTQQYNRARQTQITMELLDIVGGANALA
jgi:F-type H+-transporting ATPase subunit gamma